MIRKEDKNSYLISPLDFAIDAITKHLCEYNVDRVLDIVKMEGEVDESILHLGKPFTEEFWNVSYELYTRELISNIEKNLLGIQEPRKKKSCIAVEGIDCCGKTTFIKNLVASMKEFGIIQKDKKEDPVFVPADVKLSICSWYTVVNKGLGCIEHRKFFIPFLLETSELEAYGKVKPSEYIGLCRERDEPFEENVLSKYASSVFVVANLIALRQFWESRWTHGIFDRSLLSTFVYNGAQQLYSHDSWLRLYDKIVLIVPEREAGLKRLEKKINQDDFDKYALEQYDELTNVYTKYAARNPERFVIIEGDKHFDWGRDDYCKFLDDIGWLNKDGQEY